MAEIPIERRQQRGRMWPWLIGLLALLLIVWFAGSRRHRETVARSDTARYDTARYDTASAAGQIAPEAPRR